jgi:hypothetical protein
MRARSDPLRVLNELRLDQRLVVAGTRIVRSRFFAVLPAEGTATSKLNMAEMVRKRVLTSFLPF